MHPSESEPLLLTGMDAVIDINSDNTYLCKQNVGMLNGHMVKELNQQVCILQQYAMGGNTMDFVCRGDKAVFLPMAAVLSVLAFVVVNLYSTVFFDKGTSTFKVARNSMLGGIAVLWIACFGCSILKGRNLRRDVDVRNEKIRAEKNKIRTLLTKLNLLSPSCPVDAPALVESLAVARSISFFSQKWVSLWSEDFSPYQLSSLEGKIIKNLSYRQLYQMYRHLGDTRKRNQIFVMVDRKKKEIIEALYRLPTTARPNYIAHFIQQHENGVFSNEPELFKDFVKALPAEIKEQSEVRRVISQCYYKLTQEKTLDMLTCTDLFGAVSVIEWGQLVVLKELGEDICLPLKEDWFKRLGDVLDKAGVSEKIKEAASVLFNKVISLALQKKDWTQVIELFQCAKKYYSLKFCVEFFDYEFNENEVCSQHANLAIDFDLKVFRTRIEKALIEEMNKERKPLAILKKYRDIPELYKFLQKNAEKYIDNWNFKEFWDYVEKEDASILREACLQYAVCHEKEIWKLWKSQEFPEAIAERLVLCGRAVSE